jgi:hypothetical protein
MKARVQEMAGVFISYRREDSPGHAGRVFDRVRARFGSDVFMDVTAIDAGADFVDAIDKAVGTCDVLLAIIGPQWAGAADGAGRRRLENANDFIRLEIAGALKRNVRVVPVLVDDARFPAGADLPDDLQPLLRRNAVELRDARWDADIEQLLASLERIVKPKEAPWRLERAPWLSVRVKALVALAVLAASVGAAVVLGPRAWAPAPVTTTSRTTAAITPPAAPETLPASPPTGSAPAASTAAKATVPDVVGRPLPEARAILRRAGVDVARVLYRDDRTKAVDLVVVQSDVRTSAASPPAVALTAVARAAVVVHHRPEDADMARRLAGALTASPATAGLAVRTLQMAALRPDAVARVTYSDGALAGTAADVATDVSSWLAQNDPGRPALSAALHPPVVSRTIVIGLPVRSSTNSSAAALPDVRGLGLAEARRKLSAAGVPAVQVKWSDAPGRKPSEVVGQMEVPGRTGERTVALDVAARATLFVEYVESDRPVVERLARELRQTTAKLGILLRLQPVSAVKPVLIGKVFHGEGLPREAATVATLASNWLMKELGRPVVIQPATDSTVDSRTMLFGLPLLDPRR